MLTRVITGVLAGALFLFFLWYGSIPFTVLVGLMAAIAFFEWMNMNTSSKTIFAGLVGILTTVLFVIGPELMSIEQVILLSAAALTLLSYSVFSENRFTINEVAYLLLGVFYTGFGFWLLVQARDNSFSFVLFILILIWTTDSGAYFVGRQFGKRKLAPHISPKKTIEGAFGGVAASIVAAFIFISLTGLELSMNLEQVIFTAVSVSVFGQLGDLAQSALKRFMNVKDSGRLLPGHGGLLDRCDSWLFVFPVLKIIGVI